MESVQASCQDRCVVGEFEGKVFGRGAKHHADRLALREVEDGEKGRDDERAALARDAALLVYPGGDHESYRPSWKSSEIDFAGRKGFVRLALELDVPYGPVTLDENRHGIIDTFVAQLVLDEETGEVVQETKYIVPGVDQTFGGTYSSETDPPVLESPKANAITRMRGSRTISPSANWVRRRRS